MEKKRWKCSEGWLKRGDKELRTRENKNKNKNHDINYLFL